MRTEWVRSLSRGVWSLETRPYQTRDAASGGRVPDLGRHGCVVGVKLGQRQIGLAVDWLLGEQEVVVKSLGDLIGDVPALVQRLAADRSEWRWSDARDADEPARVLAHRA